MFYVLSPLLSAADAAGLAAITTITSAFITALVTRYKVRQTIVEQFQYLPLPDDEEINAKFYDALVEKINKASNTILVTGAGFESNEFLRPRGRRIVNNYVHALKDALRRDVKIARIQTQGPISNDWTKMLKELIVEFPSNFELYYLPVANRGKNIINFGVIDPDLSRATVVEILISSKLIRGTSSLHVAGNAIFITGNQKLSETMLYTFTSMKNSVDTIYIKEASMLDQYSET
jgi:hypothetical protein